MANGRNETASFYPIVLVRCSHLNHARATLKQKYSYNTSLSLRRVAATPPHGACASSVARSETMAISHEWLRGNPPILQGDAEREGDKSTMATYANSTVPEALFAQARQPQHCRRRRAPGLAASSRSSENILEQKQLSLSPVTGPGATTFSSVASAFDFQHHLGSDPARELLVLKRILARECLLSRLEVVCGQLRKRRRLPPATFKGVESPPREGTDRVMDMLSSMRDATVAVVEAVEVWRDGMTGHPPLAFVWHGENYLLKLTNDLNFLAGVEPLVAALKMHPARFCRNPLMLPQTLDEQRRDGELFESDVDAASSRVRKKRHLYQVAQVLLDEEGLEQKRECLRQEANGATNAMPGRVETSPALGGFPGIGSYDDQTGVGVGCRKRSCTADSVRQMASQINGMGTSCSPTGFTCGTDSEKEHEALRRQQQLCTWYEEARSQLVSLSTSLADEEYFLSSRRFWSKEELRNTGGCGPQVSSSLSRRRPPILRRGKRTAFAAASQGRSGFDGGLEQETALRRDKGGCLGRAHRSRRHPTGGRGYLFRGDGVGMQQHGVELFGQGLMNRQEDFPRQTRRLQGLGTGVIGKVGVAQEGEGVHGSKEHGIREGPDECGENIQWGSGKSAALSCLTAHDIEQLLREENPLPVTTAVCAAIVFLLAPDDRVPENFCWPQGFEAVAMPAADFLWRLHKSSALTASPFKARVLKLVLQREDTMPVAIERQGAHAVASLCAWALEELQSCEEFVDWSQLALKPWYEMQLIPVREDVPEGTDGPGVGATLVYKSMHLLSNVGGSYVISLFEEKNDNNGLVVRAFDRARMETFWLSLSRKQLASLGANAMRSPAHLAAALARRVKIKIEDVSGSKRLILPPVKGAESHKKPKRSASKQGRDTQNVVDAAGAEVVVAAAPLPPRLLPIGEGTAQEQSESTVPQQCRSRQPSTRDSTTNDHAPLAENEVNNGYMGSVGGEGIIQLGSRAASLQGMASDAASAETLKLSAELEEATKEVPHEDQTNNDTPSSGIGDGKRHDESATRPTVSAGPVPVLEIVTERGTETTDNNGLSPEALEKPMAEPEEIDFYGDDFGDGDDEEVSTERLEKDACADTEPVDAGKTHGAINDGGGTAGSSPKDSIAEGHYTAVGGENMGVLIGSSGTAGTLEKDAQACGGESEQLADFPTPKENKADTFTQEKTGDCSQQCGEEIQQTEAGVSEGLVAEAGEEFDEHGNKCRREDVEQDEPVKTKSARTNESKMAKTYLEARSPSVGNTGAAHGAPAGKTHQREHSNKDSDCNEGARLAERISEAASCTAEKEPPGRPSRETTGIHCVSDVTAAEESDGYDVEDEFEENTGQEALLEKSELEVPDNSPVDLAEETIEQPNQLPLPEAAAIASEAAVTDASTSIEEYRSEFDDAPTESVGPESTAIAIEASATEASSSIEGYPSEFVDTPTETIGAEAPALAVEAAATEASSSIEAYPSEFDDAPTEDFEVGFEVETEAQVAQSALKRGLEDSEAPPVPAEEGSRVGSGVAAEDTTLENNLAPSEASGSIKRDSSANTPEDNFEDDFEDDFEMENAEKHGEVVAPAATAPTAANMAVLAEAKGIYVGAESIPSTGVLDAVEAGDVLKSNPVSKEQSRPSEVRNATISDESIDGIGGTFKESTKTSKDSKEGIEGADIGDMMENTIVRTEPICDAVECDHSAADSITQDDFEQEYEKAEDPEPAASHNELDLAARNNHSDRGEEERAVEGKDPANTPKPIEETPSVEVNSAVAGDAPDDNFEDDFEQEEMTQPTSKEDLRTEKGKLSEAALTEQRISLEVTPVAVGDPPENGGRKGEGNPDVNTPSSAVTAKTCSTLLPHTEGDETGSEPIGGKRGAGAVLGGEDTLLEKSSSTTKEGDSKEEHDGAVSASTVQPEGRWADSGVVEMESERGSGLALGGERNVSEGSGQQGADGELVSGPGNVEVLLPERTPTAQEQEGVNSGTEGLRHKSPPVGKAEAPPHADEGQRAEDQTSKEASRLSLDRAATAASDDFEDDFEDP